MRGAAALVGIADVASPTGELDLYGRALEVSMVEAALADAGLTIDDVDGVCHPMSSMLFAEYLGIHPRFTDSNVVRVKNTSGTTKKKVASAKPHSADHSAPLARTPPRFMA